MKHKLIKINNIQQGCGELIQCIDRYEIVNILISGKLNLLFKEVELFLSKEEWLLASRISLKKIQENFLLRRSLLRLLLSKIKNSCPMCVDLIYFPQKKPYVTEGPFFSHANKPDSLLYSFSKYTEIGADIEKVDPEVDIEGIAQLYFSPIEQSELRQIPNKLKKQYFFRQWTKKEAQAKCLEKVVQNCAAQNKNIYTFKQAPFFLSIAFKNSIKTMASFHYFVQEHEQETLLMYGRKKGLSYQYDGENLY